MSMSDPMADMFTRLRNACKAKHRKVDMPASNLKREIARILLDLKLINNYAFIEDGKQGYLRFYLKYDSNDESVIKEIFKVSKASRRYYVGKDELPRVLNGLGTAILSTSKGVLTDKECRQAGVGGEILCYVW